MNILKMLNSFKYAGKGILLMLKSENNFKFQLLAAAMAILVGVFLKFSVNEWILITLCMGIVLSLEMINSAIEKTIDIISPEWQTKAGQIKDISAGAVLIASIMSVSVFIIILHKHYSIQ